MEGLGHGGKTNTVSDGTVEDCILPTGHFVIVVNCKQCIFADIIP